MECYFESLFARASSREKFTNGMESTWALQYLQWTDTLCIDSIEVWANPASSPY